MRIIVDSEVTIENYPPEILQWVEDKLIFANPDFTKKQRMHLWTGNTPRQLVLYRTNQSASRNITIPFGCLRSLLQFCLDKNLMQDTEVINLFPKDPLTIDFRPHDLSLYDFQEEAVKNMLRQNFGILQAPAGSGKTQIGIGLLAKLGRKTLWVTHTKDLLEQSKARYEKYLDNSLVGTIENGKVDIGKGVTFAIINSLARLDLIKYRNEWDTVIVDECHRAAGTETTVSMYYHVLSNICARHKYGLSATPHRADGLIKTTYALLGNVICSIGDDQVSKIVMPVSIMPRHTNSVLTDEMLNSDGTINFTALTTGLTRDMPRNHMIAQDLANNSTHFNLILSDRLEHLALLRLMLPEALRNKSVMIDGKMTGKKGKVEREKALDDMRSGAKCYLFATYKLAKEGLDIPRLDRLYMATPQKDEAIIIQSIGRIARRYPDKAQPICYDYIDNIPYCYGAWRKRKTAYNKKKCSYVEEKE